MLKRSTALLFLCFAPLLAVHAQQFRAFTVLRVIETEHFRIIFPERSEKTARELAGFADDRYRRISSLLGIGVPGKIPVTITPDTGEFNGAMGPMPDIHITLYDTAADPEWTAFDNSLENLFFHELTHAVSMSSRHTFYRVVRYIFGGWVYPTGMTSPMYMTEGTAVSFESLGGNGRANDPLSRQLLIQDEYEKKFMTPFQLSGVYDLMPQAAYYQYGGLFTKFLQDRYGMERFAKLWQAMGRLYHFTFFFYNFNFYRAFQDVYGVRFQDVWKEFEAEFDTGIIEENSGGVILGGSRSITAVAASGGKIFALDKIRRQIQVVSAGGAKPKVTCAFPADTSVYDINSNGDGDRLLASSYRGWGERREAVVREYTAAGIITGREWRGLYSGSYFRDGVAGLVSDGHMNRIVYRPDHAGSREEVLISGGPELFFSRPQPLDGEWIAFTFMRRGVRGLGLYSYTEKKWYTVESAAEGAPENCWRYMRWLKKSGDHVLFAYNTGAGMYRLAAVDIAKQEAVFAEREFSGAVSMPALCGDDIYYRGSFHGRDALMRYPEKLSALSGARVTLKFIPVTEPADAPHAPEAAAVPRTKPKLYNPLPYLNPFKLWLPIPLIAETRNGISLDGAGIYSYMEDPSGVNNIQFSGGYDARAIMARADATWTNTGLGFPVNIHFFDTTDRKGINTYRTTQGTLTLGQSFGLWDDRSRFTLSGGIGIASFALDPEDGSSAYTWEYNESLSLQYIGSAGFTTMTRYAWETFGQGFTYNLTGRFSDDRQEPRLETSLAAAAEPFFPARLTLYAVRDKRGMYLDGTSPWLSSTSFDSAAPVEYANESDINYLTWLAGGEAEIEFFNAEIQRGLSHLYFNRIGGSAAYRGAFYDRADLDHTVFEPVGNYAGDFAVMQSLVMRLRLTVSSAFVTAAPIYVTPCLWAAWKISNLENDVFSFVDDFAFGLTYSTRF